MTPIPGVLRIERPIFPDSRGDFHEFFRKSELEEVLGKKVDDLVQGNISRSHQGTLRGMHIAPWDKLVCCTLGEVFQVVVDTRPDSPAFGKVFTTILSESNLACVYVPKNCGNGFLAIASGMNHYQYLVSQEYEKDKEIGLLWKDPVIARDINWPNPEPFLKELDQSNRTLKGLFPEIDFTKYPWLQT